MYPTPATLTHICACKHLLYSESCGRLFMDVQSCRDLCVRVELKYSFPSSRWQALCKRDSKTSNIKQVKGTIRKDGVTILPSTYKHQTETNI